ncbi:MAG: hypothetical protein LBT97_04000, partial [Planctomycetota bacterium]|nr:hypothetical protein [Planctomycetota bacterium]
MCRFAIPASIIALTSSSLWAAMFGPFSVPDSLRPTLYPTPGHNDRMAVVAPLSTGTSMVLYLPQQGELVMDGRVLEAIGRRLDHSREVQVFDIGGRPWFGTAAVMNGNVVFYDGYTHRNGYIYPVAFSLDQPATITPEVRDIISRTRLFPDLQHSPAGARLADA